jgi:hypothetical protein
MIISLGEWVNLNSCRCRSLNIQQRFKAAEVQPFAIEGHLTKSLPARVAHEPGMVAAAT